MVLLFGCCCCCQEAHHSIESTDEFKFEQEANCYIRISDNSTARDFWKEHETEYPLLSKMANTYCGISPGSVPTESLFSCARFLLNSRQSTMAPYKADMVTFVHDIYDVIMELQLKFNAVIVL